LDGRTEREKNVDFFLISIAKKIELNRREEKLYKKKREIGKRKKERKKGFAD